MIRLHASLERSLIPFVNLAPFWASFCRWKIIDEADKGYFTELFYSIFSFKRFTALSIFVEILSLNFLMSITNLSWVPSEI